MNQHLQSILNSIQQSGHLNADEKNALIKSIKDADKEFAITEFKLDRTEKVKRTTAILLEETIEELEQKRKAVEAQNRELEIESALERVRTVAMSMNKAEDMLDVCKTISHQLELLNVKEIRNVQTAIFYESKGTYMNYEYYAKHDKTFITETSYTNNKIHLEFAKKMLKGNGEFMAAHIIGDEVKDWVDYQKTTNVFIDDFLYTASSLNYYWFSLGPVALGISTYEPLKQEETNLFKRFLKVFELAYRRYLDIEKAEAQAREAQIEAALEKVRSRSLAVYKSDEFNEVIKVVFEKLQELGIIVSSVSINTMIEGSKDTEVYICGQNTDELSLSHFRLVYFDHLISNDRFNAQQSGLDFFSKNYGFEEKNSFFKYLFEISDLKYLPDDIKKMVFQNKRYNVSVAIAKHSIIVVNDFEGKALSEKEADTIKRFSKVFEQSYIRFLDLQNAEAQAREAQIQLALERVRARTMAMQHSYELTEAANLLFRQVQLLDLPVVSCGFNIWEKVDKVCNAYMSDEAGFIQLPFKIPLTESPVFIHFAKSRKKDDAFYAEELSGEALAAHYKYMLTLPVFAEIANNFFKAGFTFPESQINNVANFSYGNLIFITYKPVPEAHDIFKRFAKVFEQTYTRFLDLQRAEVQAREAQIQLALERARAQSMMMQHSAELDDTLRVFHEQVLQLGIPSAFSFLWLPDEEKDRHIFWAAWAENNSFKSKAINYPLDRNEPATKQCLIDWKSNEAVVSYNVSPDGVANYFAAWSELIAGVEQLKPEYFSDGLFYVEAFMKYGCFGVMVKNELQEDEKNILARFAIEFERTYTRFLDLQKAEAQAREAQIEASLERVRAKAMAMQNSDELKELIGTVFTELTKLDLVLTRCVIIIYDTKTLGATWWMANSENSSNPTGLFVKHAPHPPQLAYIKAWQERKLKWQYVLEGKIKKEWDNFLFVETELSLLPDFVIAGMKAPARVYLNASFNNFGNLTLASLKTLSNEHFDILLRFAKVFDLTYTRFNDLKQAEAQTRESQIQLALERVRARTMAMQKSDELADVSELLFKQVGDLGIKTWATGFNVWSNDNNSYEDWITSPRGGIIEPYIVDATGFPAFVELSNARKSEEQFYIQYLDGETLKQTYQELLKFGDKQQFAVLPEDEFQLPTKQYLHMVFGSKASLMFITYESVPEAHDIFKRFGNVFEQTYTRFLDLQKAEAQAKEAQIEAALESVRSSSLAMHRSDQLKGVAAVMFKKLMELGLALDGAFIFLFDRATRNLKLWIATTTLPEPNEINIPHSDSMSKNQIFKDLWSIIETDEEIFNRKYSGEVKNDYFRHVGMHNDYPQAVKDFHLKADAWITSIAGEKHCAVGFDSWNERFASPEDYKILKRFARAFEQAYVRFLDLQKAEAQSKEAKIETALERVRSRTLAMQKSDELAETSAVLFQQLIGLGIAPNRLYISIMKNNEGDTEFWITDEDGSKVSMAYEDNLNNNPSFKKMYDGWKQQKKSQVIDMKGKELQEYFQHLSSINVPFKGGLAQKRRLQYIAYFSKGFIGMASPDEQPAETLQLLERFAYVFNLTFTRFNDLQIAEAHALQAEHDLIEIKAARKKAEETLVELQSTQKQLIQSEKMASLGELTAGIAHEIQNPLNFVNNFSEVSKELLDEMKAALESGDKEEAEELANDIIQNLEKINHHGKRADAIVKGMLQHSRQTSGTKEPTDINALCDEYLRLSYHGLRAKDKNFNADFKTDFDNSIDKINIVQQNIGRVLLNLFNNAFYAVKPPNPLKGEQYKPLISVTTRKIKLENNSAVKSTPLGYGGIEIIVTDNGNGIPQNIIDKIFQPFFTTKPTGQGTGLGLSLAYDIITKEHNGTIKVESKQGEGTVFIIQLPVT